MFSDGLLGKGGRLKRQKAGIFDEMFRPSQILRPDIPCRLPIRQQLFRPFQTLPVSLRHTGFVHIGIARPLRRRSRLALGAAVGFGKFLPQPLRFLKHIHIGSMAVQTAQARFDRIRFFRICLPPVLITPDAFVHIPSAIFAFGMRRRRTDGTAKRTDWIFIVRLPIAPASSASKRANRAVSAA